jgi:uncharacterized protein DUF882
MLGSGTTDARPPRPSAPPRGGRERVWSCLLCLAGLLNASWSEARDVESRPAGAAASKRGEPRPGPGPARTTRPAPSWREYRKPAWRRGYVRLHNPGNSRRWDGFVIGPGDTLLPRAERQIRSVLASWRSGRSYPIHPRLIRLMAQVSDVFGGRPIRVVSGYREKSHAKDSHHKHGEAFDFSVDGVPNWAVRDYLRGLADTGVGFYPRSSFVHLDVRQGQAYWIDMSRPGGKPRYVANLPEPKRARSSN